MKTLSLIIRPFALFSPYYDYLLICVRGRDDENTPEPISNTRYSLIPAVAKGFVGLGTVTIILTGIIFFPFTAEAAVGINRQINFQGKLTGSDGTNVADGSYSVVFSIYDVASSGTALWTETQSVTTKDGVFRVALGSVTPFPTNFNFNWDGLYLGLKVGADTEMTPRIQFTAVPFAMNSQKVAGLTVTDENGVASTSGTLKVPNGKTISFGDAFTTTAGNALTFTTSAATNVSLPTTGTLATLAGNEILTNKTIGSTGLIFSGANTDITTAANEALTFTPGGTGNLVINPNAGGQAALMVDKLGNNDIFTASASGSPIFTITHAGGLMLGSSVGTGTQCLLGGATASWGSCGSGGSANWTLDGNNGVMYPINNTLDILMGGTATSSAKFGVINLNSGVPIASISATAASFRPGISIAGDGSIQSLNRGTLTLGGATTGQIILSPFNNQTGAKVVPGVDTIVSLGASSAARFKDFFVGPSSLHVQCTVGDGCGQGLDYAMGVNTVTNAFYLGLNGRSGTLNQLITATEGGNVGIGTSNPAYALQVGGGSNGALSDIAQIGSNGTGANTENRLLFGGNSSNKWAGISGMYTSAGAGTLNFYTQNSSSLVKQIFIDNTGSLFLDAQGANNGTVSTALIFGGSGSGEGIASKRTSAGNQFGLDFYTNSSNRLAISQIGLVGLGTTSPISELHVTRSLTQSATGKALAIFDQNENQDIFSASASASPIFTITRAGGLMLGTSVGTGTQCLLGGATASWGSCGSGGSANWTLDGTNGVMYPINNTLDILLGGTATSSAKFAFINMVGSGEPTASIAGSLTLRNGTGLINRLNGGSINFQTSPGGDAGLTTKMFIGNSGLIGMGTTTPSTELHVTRALTNVVTGKALAIFDQNENQAVLAASSSGNAVFQIGRIPVAGSSGNFLNLNPSLTAMSGSNTVRGLYINFTNATHSGSSNVLNAIDIGNITGSANATETGLNIGTGWDQGIVIASGGSTNSGLVYTGAGRPTKTITLSPEFAGAILTASGSATAVGTMTSDASPSANFRTYYEWSSSQTSLNDYTVAVRVTLPKDFSAWVSGTAMQVGFNTELATSDTNKLDVLIYNPSSSTSTPVVLKGAQTSSAKTWTTVDIADTLLTGSPAWNTANQTATIYLKMYSKDSNYVQVGDIILNYLASF